MLTAAMMQDRWKICVVVLLLALNITAAYDEEEGGEVDKRSSTYPTFDEIRGNSPQTRRIADCEFTKSSEGGFEGVIYSKKSGSCQLDRILAQLFPGFSLNTITKTFLPAEKFVVREFRFGTCSGDCVNDIEFKVRSLESLEIRPQYFTLGAGALASLAWPYADAPTLKNMAIGVHGATSLGEDKAVQVRLRKEKSGEDFDITVYQHASLLLKDYFNKFHIDVSQLLGGLEKQEVKEALNLEYLQLGSPDIKGSFSAGEGFELTVSGKVSYPEAFASGKKFFAIVQDFKKSAPDEGETERGFNKPIGAIFCLFKDPNANVQDILYSVTRMEAPDMPIFNKVKKVALTAATNHIYLINDPRVHDVAAKFVPEKGLKFVEKGVNILHYLHNSDASIKDEEGNMKKRILFRCEISDTKVSWKTPDYLPLTLQQMARMALDKSLESIVLQPTVKVAYVSIDLEYLNTYILSANFNLTESVAVLQNNLVSLLNTTMSLTSKQQNKGRRLFRSWKLSGKGEEVILDELTQATVEQDEHRTSLYATANIFSMTTLRNRTKATYLSDDLAERFPYSIDFPLKDMRYQCSFEWNKVLKLKGKLAIPQEPDIELLYFITGSGPKLKLAILYKNEYLHKVVNTFYGEERMRSTWMKFQKIGIILRKRKGEGVIFDRSFFEELDNSDQLKEDGGIGILARNFILSECPEDAKMCNFLDKQNEYSAAQNRVMIEEIDYYGRLGDKRFRMIAHTPSKYKLWLSNNLRFRGPIEFKLTSTGKGERQVLKGIVKLKATGEDFEGKLYDDGSNVLILEFGGPETQSRILGLDFARLNPVHSKSSIPDRELMEELELQSRLNLGTVEGSTIPFRGSASRQFIHLSNHDQRRFVGEKSRLSVAKIQSAFAMNSVPARLQGGEFRKQVVVGYNSYDEDWEVPDFAVTVKQGLHFYGKLKLNAAEKYRTILTVTETNQLEAEMDLTPLRYGTSLTDSQGRKNFRNVNLFLYKQHDRTETGPTLYIDHIGQRIKGYCQTIGMHGAFESKYVRGSRFQIQLSGKMYGEVDDVHVLLEARAEGNPSDFSFRYSIDIKDQVQSHSKQAFRDALSDIKNQIKKGRDSSSSVFDAVTEQYDTHVKRKTGHDEEAERIQKEIHNANQNVDQDFMQISMSCIEKCRTVSMPGIDWKEDCLKGPGSDNNGGIGCMVWNEDKEKVVNVICLLKCEADKYQASGSGISKLENIRLLLNRYKQTQILSTNEDKMIAVLEEAKDIAEQTREMIEDNTHFGSDINQLLEKQHTENMATIWSVTVDENISELVPPCLPFNLHFKIDAPGQTIYDDKYDVCFNGEFYQNMATKMLRVAYSDIDKMYKALEEAELRYAKIKGIKKSLERVMKDTEKNIGVPDEAPSQRSKIEQPATDPAMRAFERISKRVLPKFTSMNRKTRMGFEHYSPWAVARRSQVLYSMNKKPERRGVYNMTAFEGHSDCTKARKVIENYKDVAKGLKTINDHYQEGKKVYGSTKDHFNKELKESYDYLIESRNKTNLLPVDKENMMYWYRYTEAGLKDYFETYSSQLDEHNKRGLENWRSDISSFFDQGRLFNEIHQIGHQAYSRSNIPNKEAHVRSFNSVGQTMQQVLSQPGITLEQAQLMVSSIDPQIKNLHKSTFSCY